MLEENGKAVRILMDLLNGLNRSVPHIDVMSIIFDILVSLAEFKDTRSNLAKLDIVYDSVIVAMGKGEKNSEVFGKGCWVSSTCEEKGLLSQGQEACLCQ